MVNLSRKFNKQRPLTQTVNSNNPVIGNDNEPEQTYDQPQAVDSYSRVPDVNNQETSSESNNNPHKQDHYYHERLDKRDYASQQQRSFENSNDAEQSERREDSDRSIPSNWKVEQSSNNGKTFRLIPYADASPLAQTQYRNHESVENDASQNYSNQMLLKNSVKETAPVTNGNIRSDEQITEDINQRLFHHPEINADEIEVFSKSGEITITGLVNKAETKYLIEDVVSTVLGVTVINNKIKTLIQFS